MEREARAKAVSSVWGAEFIQFLACFGCFASVDLKEKDEKELNQFCPPNGRDDLCLCFSLHSSSMI